MPSETQRKNSHNRAIVILTLQDFSMVGDAADRIKQDKYVMINLEKMSDEDKQRSLDYFAGVIRMLGFSEEQIADDLFLFSPEGTLSDCV